MRRAFLLAVLLLPFLPAAPVRAQSETVVQAWYEDPVAFTWPLPFTHVPQTFVRQAVRFTAPDASGTVALTAVDLHVWPTSASPDGFNDLVRLAFLPPTPEGYPDDERPYAPPAERIFAELIPGTFNTIDLAEPLVLAPGAEVWVAVELVAEGEPDQLVMVSGAATTPALDRAAAYVEGEGWKLMRETQFGAEYVFQMTAAFTVEEAGTAVETPAAPAFRLETYPNPAADRLAVRCVLPRPQPVGWTLYDLAGRRLVHRTDGIRPAGPHTATLDLRALAPGTYVLRLDGTAAARLVTVVR